MLQYQNEGPNIVISSLQKQLRRYKEELQLWKLKYAALQQQHNQLIQLLKEKNLFENLPIRMGKNEETSFMREKRNNSKEFSIELPQQQFEKPSTGNNSLNRQQHLASQNPYAFQGSPRSGFQRKLTLQGSSPFAVMQVPITTEGQEPSSPSRSPRLKEQDQKQIDFFCIEQIQKHTSNEEESLNKAQEQQTKQKKGFDLMEGYFILQKIDSFRENTKNYSLWIKDGNQELVYKQKNLLQIVYRYTFREQPLLQIEDDPFDSRVNEIKYGTPYEELIYSFDNYQPNQEEQSRVMFKSTRKKYVHCLIRPEITLIDGKAFETEILYGFVSSFPFRTFFQDLHRTIQQEIKFQLLSSNHVISQDVQVSKEMRISIVSGLMSGLFEYCRKKCSNITNYPIKLTIETKVSALKIQIESQQTLRQMQRQNLQILLKKYNLLKICKILHYVLTQKQLIIVSLTRKHLNQIFEIIRLMIKPFYWVFPIVYRYSDHFEPFLSSPLPLIIGIVYDFTNKNCKENKILMKNQFVTIFVEQNAPQQKQKQLFFFFTNKSKHSTSDLRELAIYQKDIHFLEKYLLKTDKKSKSNQSQRIQKYISRLRHLIQTGSLDCELSTFMIDFLDAQMVQSYKDLVNGSHRKLLRQDQINESMAMIR